MPRFAWVHDNSVKVKGFSAHYFQTRQSVQEVEGLPAPVAAVCPSGDMARYRARLVCPLREPSLVRLGAFHKCMALSTYP